jgi:hypothetical protein
MKCEGCGQPSEGRFCAQCILLAVGPRATDTLLGRALADAARDPAAPLVIGTVPLAAPNWARDPVPIEPPLGIDIEAVPDLGFGGRRDE